MKSIYQDLTGKGSVWQQWNSTNKAARQALALGTTAMAGTTAGLGAYGLYKGLSGDGKPPKPQSVASGNQPGQENNFFNTLKNMSNEDMLGYGGSALGLGLLGYLLGNSASPNNGGLGTLLGLLGAAGGAYAYHKYKNGGFGNGAPA